VTILKSKANDEWKEDLEKSFGYVNLIYKKKKKNSNLSGTKGRTDKQISGIVSGQGLWHLWWINGDHHQ